MIAPFTSHRFDRPQCSSRARASRRALSEAWRIGKSWHLIGPTRELAGQRVPLPVSRFPNGVAGAVVLLSATGT